MARGSKKQPRRSCLSCREQREKLALVRLVRASDGSVHVDESRSIPGRGGYLCELADCWEHALKSGQIERSLRTTVTPQDRVTLQDYARRFAIVKVVESAQAEAV